MYTRIGKYRIDGEIGRGGFGQVYHAFDPSVGRDVAIKVLNPGADASFLERFRNEAVTAGNLQHKNIVTVYEFGEHDGLAYLVMEFLPGQDLQRVIQAGGPGSLLQTVQIMSQVASGLHSAHVHGVVHRDVKPANIMLLPDGNVKIMDFGIARLLNARNPNQTQAGMVVGSVRYMSPEQFGAGPIDALCDIWGYGVIYYELITGRHPFPVAELGAAMYQIQHVEPQPVNEIVPSCPAALADIVSRALAKDRELRYQSMEDLRIDTEPIRVGLQKEEAARLVRKAQEFAGRGEWEFVESIVKQILDLDSTNQIARELRETIRRRTQRRSIQFRKEALIKKGSEQLSIRQYQAAIDAFEAALRLDESNPSIRSLLAEARDKSERSKRAGELVSTARADLETRNLTGAFERASEALRIDPDNPDALATLTAVRAVAPSRDTGDRRMRLRVHVEASKDLLQRGSPADAVARLQSALIEFPEDREVQQLLSYAQQLEAQRVAEALQLVRTEAQRLIEAQDHDAARQKIETALKAHPGDSGLLALLQAAASGKAAQKREAAILDALRRAEVLARQNRAAEALEIVTQAAGLYSGDTRLLTIRDRLREHLRRRESAAAIRKAIGEAQDLSKAGDVERAIALLQSNLERFPDSEELRRARDAAHNEKARQDEQRIAIERARRLEQDEQRVAAWGVITAVLRAYPESESLRAFETRLRQRMTEEERTYAATRERADIEELILGRRYREALERAEYARNADQADESLQQLYERVQSIIREERDRYVSRIRAALEVGGVEQAEELLVDGLRALPGENALAELKREIDQQRDYRQLITTARRQLEGGEVDNAERSAKQALNIKAEDPAAQEVLQAIGRHRAEKDRKRRIDHARKSARELLAMRRFNDARNFLRAAMKSFPEVTEFHADLAEVDAAQQNLEDRKGSKQTGY